MKKNSLGGMKILTAILCVLVVGYFGLQGYRYLADPLTTSPAYAYQVEQSVTVTGWVIRQEQILTAPETGLLRLTRSEGEKVARGGEVAAVYSDQASLDLQEEIQTMAARIEQLEYAKESAMNNEAVLRLDNQILTGILDLRTAVTAGRLDQTDGSLSQLRTYVLKRDYSYSAGSDLDAELKTLQDKLSAAQKKAASSRKVVRAPVSGLYSAVVDGYENVLTPETAQQLTPSALAELEKDESLRSRVGKIITGDTWYFAATVPTASLGKIRVGNTVQLRFAAAGTSDLAMKVESICQEGEESVLLLSSRADQPRITLLRQQSADIVWNTVDGIRVPSAAIRVSEEGVTGVYCVVGMNARFKPVEVVYTGGDGYALVRGTSTVEKTRLRSGDTVIVTAFGLFDGKIVG